MLPQSSQNFNANVDIAPRSTLPFRLMTLPIDPSDRTQTSVEQRNIAEREQTVRTIPNPRVALHEKSAKHVGLHCVSLIRCSPYRNFPLSFLPTVSRPQGQISGRTSAFKHKTHPLKQLLRGLPGNVLFRIEHVKGVHIRGIHV